MSSSDITTNTCQSEHGQDRDLLIIPQKDSLSQASTFQDHVNKVLSTCSTNNPTKFPLAIFPENIQHILRSTNQCLQYPIDFIGSAILFAASVAIGNTHRIEFKRGWQESALIYMALVAPKGTNKSHPLKFALQPILDIDSLSYIEYEKIKLEFDECINNKQNESGSKSERIKPTYRKYILSDSTLEAVADRHKFNLRGIGVYNDELAGWFKNFNRYNNGSEMEFWLSVWTGTPINIDRKTGEPIRINFPFVSVVGTIQTSLLKELAKGDRIQNGFIDRILFVMPNSIKKTYWSEDELPQSVHDSWGKIVHNLISLSIAFNKESILQPKVLYFSSEAKKMLFKWQIENADKCNEEQRDDLKGFYSKLEIYALRLSLVLQMIFYACNEGNNYEVGIRAVSGALELVEYFGSTATKVYSVLSYSNNLDVMTSKERKIFESLPSVFTTGNAVEIAESLGMPERTTKNFIKNDELFTRIDHGKYQKNL